MIVQRIYTKCMALPRLPHMMMMMTVFVGNTRKMHGNTDSDQRKKVKVGQA